jgi:hypothetical protein
MTTLTPTLQRAVTADWNQHFGGLGLYKPMQLGRLVGPFYQGICLERDARDARYYPTAHIHCLGIDFPTVSLTLKQRLKGGKFGTDRAISIQSHAKHFAEAAAQLAQASLLPLTGPWGLKDLLRAVNTFDKAGPHYTLAPFEAAVIGAAWLGDKAQANAALTTALSIIATWPARVLASRDGGLDKWEESLRRLIDDADVLRSETSGNIKKLKVGKLPQIEMRD